MSQTAYRSRQPARSNPSETTAAGGNAMDRPPLDYAEASVFLPPWDLISRHIVDDGNSGDDVVVSRKLLRFLIRCLLDHTEFDEQQYRRANPDVAEAIRHRDFASARDHFLNVGYFESRTGATPVQETWYLARNPDVAAAKQSGDLESGEQQYRLAGAQEWREPNPQSVKWIAAWKEVLDENRR
jgi:hypothetical protein